MPKSKIVSLQYNFIFTQSANAWSNLYEFEKDLSDFFAANGLEAAIVVPIQGNGGVGVMMIEKIANEDVLTNQKGPQLSANPTMGKAQKSTQIINKLTNKIGVKK